MREISYENIADTVAELCVRSCTMLPPDVAIMLECAFDAEESEAGRDAIGDIIENFNYASRTGLPICQDTGITVVFADIGQDVHITGGNFEDAINEGVRRGYDKGGLRKSVVGDPLRRENTGDNTPAVIHTRIVPGDRLSITVAPKGAGSENMSDMKLFLPSATAEDIEDFIADVMSRAGANPCPPVIIGVGLGGTIEKAAELSKRALLRGADTRNPDPFYAEMERRALKKINDLGIGPQGFGGRTTAIAVNIEAYATHIACLPCVVNMGCHANRHASAEI